MVCSRPVCVETGGRVTPFSRKFRTPNVTRVARMADANMVKETT
jgi:hypothetical protein